jgi:hypothetical protein
LWKLGQEQQAQSQSLWKLGQEQQALLPVASALQEAQAVHHALVPQIALHQ